MNSRLQVRVLSSGPSPQTPRFWYDSDPFTTHFFNAVSSTFPEGERFFIQSVRRYAGTLQDPDLKAQVDDFAGQEGQHSRAHDHHVDLLCNQGFEALASLNRVEKTVMRWFTRHTPRYALALTTAIEHLTSIAAEQILAHPRRWLSPMHPDMQRLWGWHAIEETEHKAVAFDVYQQAVGSVWLRRTAMLQATIGFLFEIWFRHSLMLYKERMLTPARLLRGWPQLFGKQGFLRVCAPGLGAFYRRDFHPWDNDNRALLAERRRIWLEV